MKTGSNGESAMETGFWTRLANAFRAHETSSTDRLESRIARLEEQVAHLIGREGAPERERVVQRR